jgi:hypothetical protein
MSKQAAVGSLEWFRGALDITAGKVLRVDWVEGGYQLRVRDRVLRTARGELRLFKTLDAVLSFVRQHFGAGVTLQLLVQAEPWPASMVFEDPVLTRAEKLGRVVGGGRFYEP